MKMRETGRSDLLELRGGGGGLILFGFPFFAAGVFVLALGLGLLPIKDGPPAVFAIPFGGIFGLAGFAIMFGRRGCVLDKKRRTIEYWTRLVVPLSHKTYSFDDVQRVTLTREIRRSNNSSYTVFPVRIVGENVKVDLDEPRRYDAARMLAERVAGFLELPLADASTGTEVVRAPDELDKSLKERLQEQPEEAELPPQPENMQTKILRKGDAVRLEIPAADTGPIPRLITIFFMFGELIFIAVVVGLLFASGRNLPAPVKIFILLFVAAAAAVSMVFVRRLVSQVGGAVTVIATPRRVEIERQGLLGKRKQSMDVREIEELFVSTTQGQAADPAQQVPQFLAGLIQAPIVIRSDRHIFQFGGHLSAEEKDFLAAVLKHAIRGG